MDENKTLWEILVPRKSNDGTEYPLSYHHQLDEQAQIEEIMELTLNHYAQEAIFAYEASARVKIKSREPK